jgi:uncharacterized protein
MGIYMKRICILSIFLSYLFIHTNAQKTTSGDTTFTGAVAELSEYKAIYQLNSSDSAVIVSTLRNIQNALSDPRLKGKLTVELIAHGSGVAVYRKDKPYEQLLLNLKKQGVILAQCMNTLKERGISKEQLHAFVSYVPSGNGELIIRQQQGWVYIHP